jgi:hypothetical protein
LQVKTRLKHLFCALETWKRGHGEDAAPASRYEGAAHSGLTPAAAQLALDPRAESSSKAAGIKRSDAEATPDSSGKASASANSTAKRPLKKERSGSGSSEKE